MTERYQRNGELEAWLRRLSTYQYAIDLVAQRRVLEVGCGTGLAAHYLANQGATHVMGVDSSESAIRVARDQYRLTNLEYRAEDLAHLQLDDGAFDVVVVPEGALVLRRSAVLQELRRVLARQGHLVFVGGSADRPAATGGASYYEFVDRLEPLFAPVRMAALSPFVGAAVVEYTGDGTDPTVSLDTSLLELARTEDDVTDYLAICGGIASDVGRGYTLVQMPAAPGVRAMAQALGSAADFGGEPEAARRLVDEVITQVRALQPSLPGSGDGDPGAELEQRLRTKLAATAAERDSAEERIAAVTTQLADAHQEIGRIAGDCGQEVSRARQEVRALRTRLLDLEAQVSAGEEATRSTGQQVGGGAQPVGATTQAVAEVLAGTSAGPSATALVAEAMRVHELELHRARIELEERDALAAELAEERDELTRELGDLGDELAALRARYAEQGSAFGDARTRAAVAEGELLRIRSGGSDAGAIADAIALRAQLDEATASLTERSASLGEARTQLAARGAELGSCRAELEELKVGGVRELEDLRRQLAEVEADRDRHRLLLSELTGERDGLRGELAALAAERATERAEQSRALQEANADSGRSEQQLAELSSELDHVREELAATVEELEGLRKELAAQERVIESAQQEVMARAEEVDAANQRIDELDQAHLDAADALRARDAELEQARRTEAETQRARDAEQEQARRTEAEAQRARDAEQEQAGHLEAELGARAAELEQARCTEAELLRDLTDARDAVKAVQGQLDALRGDRDQLRSELEPLRAELQQLREASAVSTEHGDRETSEELRERLTALELRLAEKSKSLAKANTRIALMERAEAQPPSRREDSAKLEWSRAVAQQPTRVDRERTRELLEADSNPLQEQQTRQQQVVLVDAIDDNAMIMIGALADRLVGLERALQGEQQLLGEMDAQLQALHDQLHREGVSGVYADGDREHRIEELAAELGGKDADIMVLQIGVEALRARLTQVVGDVHAARAEMTGRAPGDLLACMDELTAKLDSYAPANK